MTAPTKAQLQAELARLQRRATTLTRRAERAESALRAGEAREEALAGNLNLSLEQQAAAGEILGLINSSPTDVAPVFDGILRSALRLAGANYGAVTVMQGESLHLAAAYGTTPEWHEVAQRIYPLRIDANSASGQAIMERRAVFVSDAPNSPLSRVRDLARTMGYRCQLMVPMLRQETALGVIALVWQEARELPSDQLSLLQTFADQAVIANENVRLFTELQARNADLSEALEQQTATADILKVISSSPTDTRPVFEAIAANAARLCSANDAQVLRVEGAVLRLVAAAGAPSMPAVRQLTRGHLVGRTVIDKKTIHVRDLVQALAEYPETTAAGYGVQSARGVPLLRDGVALGVIRISRTEVRPFTDKQIALVETFADQAVIAIENVRLFTELAARNRDLTEALEQQTATADILRVISSSPTNLQPVLDAVAESAARLCAANDAHIYRLDGDVLRFAASYGSIGTTALAREHGVPVVRGTVTGRSVIDRRTVHVHDLVADLNEFPESRPFQARIGFRTTLATPLLREGSPLGAILIRRMEVRPFSDGQIKVLETFADQAVIAIENVRLFTELEARNKDLTESLEQQTATSDILKVIASTPTDLTPVFETICWSAVRLFNAYGGSIRRFDGELVHLAAVMSPNPGADERLRSTYPRRPHPETAADRPILERGVVHIPDTEDDPWELSRQIAHDFGYRRLVGVPMLREGQVVGSISVTGAEPGPYSVRQIDLLKTFADQAVIAIENVRLFKELEARNADLTQSLDRQTATAEILRVISGSRTDVQPVFDAIVRSAVRLCGALNGVIFRAENGLQQMVSFAGITSAEWVAFVQRMRASPPVPSPPVPGTVLEWVVTEGALLHVPDIEREERFPRTRALARTMGYRSVLSVPMLRDGVPVGVILLNRTEPFTEAQIQILQTFADQAVIAIENARLLSELEARTGELTRSVEQLTALGEVGRAVSSSLDLETVLTTIVARAVELSGLDGGSIYEYDETREEFELRTSLNTDEALVRAQREARPRKGEGVVGRTAVTLEPAQVADIAAEGAYESRMRETLLRAGVRAVLAVPLLREGRLIGSLVVIRNRPGEFAADVVQLLATFASQSALAIQNARLFRQLEDKGQEIEVANRHKSEFLANMSHELRTPLNAIIGYSEMLEEDAAELDGGRLVPDLEKINAAGKHLLELINAVLDLSKIEAGKMELYLEDFDVARLVQDVAAVIKPLAEKNGNHLEVACALCPRLRCGDVR